MCVNTLRIRRAACHDAGALVRINFLGGERWPKGKGFYRKPQHIRFRHTTRHAIELDGVVVGCVVFSVDRRRVVIERFVIGSEYRRLALGTMAIARIVQRAVKGGRFVVTTIPEMDYRAIAFLKSCGWEAIRVERDYFKDCDGIRFCSPALANEVCVASQQEVSLGQES